MGWQSTSPQVNALGFRLRLGLELGLEVEFRVIARVRLALGTS